MHFIASGTIAHILLVDGAGLLLFISAGIIFGAISAVADQVTKD